MSHLPVPDPTELAQTQSDLSWIDPAAPPQDGVYRLVVAMAERQAAVGWLTVPPRSGVVAWLDDVLGGGARMVAVHDPDGQLVASGYWVRQSAAVLAHSAEIRKVMVHPDAQGRGLGQAVVSALVADATAAGVELLLLDVRGNNHAALRLYARLGFVVSGRRPDLIAVGAERFDQVLMHLDLRNGPGDLSRNGGRRSGPGHT